MREFWKTEEWLRFRSHVLESDGHRCRACNRREGPKVILQVHHKQYFDGRKPWEYALSEVETLCRGCHGSRHRFWPPLAGWEEVGEEDLGDLCGECDLCGTSIRHVHELWHPDWGTLDVGAGCAEALTEREGLTEQQLVQRREARFIGSRRWREVDNKWMIDFYGIEVLIINQAPGRLRIAMNGATSLRRHFVQLDDAKRQAFAAINSGDAMSWLVRHAISLRPPTGITRRSRRRGTQPELHGATDASLALPTTPTGTATDS